MTLPVFLSEDLTPEPARLTVGDSATLSGAEGRHAASVRRIGAGEWVDVVDGAGLRLRCEVSEADKSSLSLLVREIVRESAPDPEVYGDWRRPRDSVGFPARDRPVEGGEGAQGSV